MKQQKKLNQGKTPANQENITGSESAAPQNNSVSIAFQAYAFLSDIASAFYSKRKVKVKATGGIN